MGTGCPKSIGGFGPRGTIEVKGKGPTDTSILTGRR